MSKSAMIDTERLVQIDYSLVGVNAALAIERGLAEADWYQCPVLRETMHKLLERRDGPAIRHTLLWFFLLFMTAAATVKLWHTWWAVLPYLIYSVLYAIIHFKKLRTAAFAGFLTTAKTTDYICFTPELLNPEIYYARVFPTLPVSISKNQTGGNSLSF